MENIILSGKWEDGCLSIPASSVDLVITDPPYQTTPHAWDRRPDWNLFMKEMGRVCAKTGQLWIFVRMPWAADVYLAAEKNGWKYVQERIWVKQNAGGCTVKELRKIHENIWHFKRPDAKTFNSDAIREVKTSIGDKSVKQRTAPTTQFFGTKNSAYKDNGTRKPKSVVFCRNLHMSKESFGHPTQKPLEVIEPLVLYSSNPGDIVLDPFCGTGTTLEAAQKTGRRWLGIEMDPKWAHVASQRLKKKQTISLDSMDESLKESHCRYCEKVDTSVLPNK